MHTHDEIHTDTYETRYHIIKYTCAYVNVQTNSVQHYHIYMHTHAYTHSDVQSACARACVCGHVGVYTDVKLP